MAFVGSEGVDFDDFDTPYISVFPNFGSSRRVRDSNNTAETRRTPARPIDADTPIAEVAEVAEVKPVNPVPASNKERGVNENDSIVTVLSGFAILNSITDFVALGLFLSLGKSPEATIMIFGLAFATFLRIGAVWQYSRNINLLSKFLNVIFGSRYGWSEKYDRKLLTKASVGVQFGFPLILHSVSDLVQEGCSFYPLFITITGGSENLESVEFAVFVIALITTLLAMLGTLLIRISYGARLVELSFLTTFSTMFLAFVLLQIVFDEFVEDKIYTRELVFPWIKFLTISTSAFTKTAIEVRSGSLINLPTILTGCVFSILIVDLIAVVFIRTEQETFIEENQDILDENIVVDQVIYANLAYDVYAAMFMAIQYILITQGDLM